MSTISKGLNKHDRALIHDDINSELLLFILVELKKITTHLALLNNEEVTEGDVEK